jgi:hydroxylamine oxidation protein HaoB
MKRAQGVALMLAGAALLAWAGRSYLEPPPLPYEAAPAPAEAPPEFVVLSAAGLAFERIEFRERESHKPLAAGVVARGADGRQAPLAWRNAVTEPILFADASAADEAKVLAAVRAHVPQTAVVLSWWDMSRRIRALAGRNAPLDDPAARGLLFAAAWSGRADVADNLRGLWSALVPAGDAAAFGKFVDALLADEATGASVLAELAGGKEAYVAVHLSDIWKAAAARPDRLSIAYKDFPGGDLHGVVKAAREWMIQERIEGGFAVEPIGAAVRLHYFPRRADGDRLLARLLPFSTSNPAALERLTLVYQHKGWWIYRLALTTQ